MEVVGEVLLQLACAIVAIVYGVAIAANGTSAAGWRRTSWFYVASSLATLPVSVFLQGIVTPRITGIFVYVGMLRALVSPPLFVAGIVIAALARPFGHRNGLVLAVACVELGSFVVGFLQSM